MCLWKEGAGSTMVNHRRGHLVLLKGFSFSRVERLPSDFGALAICLLYSIIRRDA